MHVCHGERGNGEQQGKGCRSHSEVPKYERSSLQLFDHGAVSSNSGGSIEGCKALTDGTKPAASTTRLVTAPSTPQARIVSAGLRSSEAGHNGNIHVAGRFVARWA